MNLADDKLEEIRKQLLPLKLRVVVDVCSLRPYSNWVRPEDDFNLSNRTCRSIHTHQHWPSAPAETFDNNQLPVNNTEFGVLTDKIDTDKIFSEYLAKLGFFPTSGWQEVSSKNAVLFLTEVIAFNMAYSVRVMPDENASKLAAIFLNFFNDKSLYFTNITPQSMHNYKTWSPLSENTFDTGLVAISETNIGILWIMDED